MRPGPPRAPGPAAIGFVVAGGRSRRMARDKALLPWGTGTLLDHAIQRVQEACGQAHILCGAEERYLEYGLASIRDDIADVGPLGALLTGLGRLGKGPGLFLAVDVPRIPVALLRHLIALQPGFDAVVPVLPAGPEPVCAVYGGACLEPVRRRIAAGERTMTCFWPEVRVRPVPVAELAEFGDPAELFGNVNTPEDYARLAGDSAV